MNMAPTAGYAIAVAWLAWVLSWLAAAAWSTPTVSRAGYARQASARLVVLLGALLLFGFYATDRSLFTWPVGPLAGWVLFAGVIAGMAFAWWARLHLGPLWSGSITRKEGHRIVDSGPYAFVRHPIYTGMLFAALVTAAQRGRIEPMIGGVLFAIGLWMQARLEEQFLAQQLGEENYAAYRKRVPMLIPFLKGKIA
jgi:protein-S-isoprenylcysteine O-methyltransferase Ste14